MNKIFEGKIYDILPKTDGIIFSYQKAHIDDGEVVWFKMLSLENALMTDVGKNIYWNIKFGGNYEAAVKTVKNFVAVKSVILPGNRLFLCDDDGQAFVIDSDGSVNLVGELKYRDKAPSGIAFHQNSIWASFADRNVLMRFNINTMRAELRIGGKNSPFDKPYGIYIDGDDAYVSNSGSKNLVKVNLKNYTVEERYNFEEPIRSYIKSGNYEFVLLDSGLYVI